MNRFTHLPFRTFLLDVFKKLEFEDFVKLKELVQSSTLLGRGTQFPYNTDEDIHEILLYLQSSGYIKPNNVTVLYTLFTHIDRTDLLDDVHQYESNILQIDPREGSQVKSTKKQLFTRILILASILTTALLFDSKVGFYSGLQFLTESFYLKLLMLCLITAAYIYNDELRDNYRYFKFTWGCIPGSLLFFEYATKDYQKAMIEDCNEFHFERLQQKYPYITKSTNVNMHYFLNSNRCINGGERHVASFLDGKKAILGDEVFGLEAGTNIVHTYSTKYHTWLPFLKAKNIIWKKSAEYAKSILASLGN